MVEINEPVLRIAEVDSSASVVSPGDESTSCHIDRSGEMLKRLRLELLNEEERKERNMLGLPGYFLLT